MRQVVDTAPIRGDRFIQIGLRGWWPRPTSSPGCASRAFAGTRCTRWTSADSALPGGGDRCRQAWEHVFLSVDIDSLDPAYAPGTGTPEIGGLTPRELGGRAPDHRRAPVVEFELVEVSPPYDPTRITAVNAHRLVLEALSGLGLRRSGRPVTPRLDSRSEIDRPRTIWEPFDRPDRRRNVSPLTSHTDIVAGFPALGGSRVAALSRADRGTPPGTSTSRSSTKRGNSCRRR